MTIDPDDDPAVDSHLRAIAHALVAGAPDVPDVPDFDRGRPRRADRRDWRTIAGIAASAIALGGAAGLALTRVVNEPADRGPVAVSPAVVGTAATSEPGTAAPGATMPPCTNAYTVVTGDFLAGIAAQFGVTLDELARLNAWPDGMEHPLLPGDTVLVPAEDCPVAPTTSVVSGVAGEQRYVVVMGDSLAGIAERFGVTVESLAEYNQWPDDVNHAIFVDDVILIPPGPGATAESTLPATSSLAGSLLLVKRRLRARH